VIVSDSYVGASTPLMVHPTHSHICVRNLEPPYFAGLEQLQRDCYPMLGAQELMRVEHYASHYRVFREGQIVVVDEGQGDRVIGQGSGFFLNFDFEHPNHSFSEICDGFYFRTHNPAGGWYYGADISVHPDYRGLGLGKLIYAARMGVVQRHNRRGIVAGGMIPGYARVRGQMSQWDYVQRVVAGELTDPTLSFQLRNGFQVRGMIENYMEDHSSDNWAVLIVWENPAYRPE
jgi:GNAT superfamily N-acetyltransferase